MLNINIMMIRKILRDHKSNEQAQKNKPKDSIGEFGQQGLKLAYW